MFVPVNAHTQRLGVSSGARPASRTFATQAGRSLRRTNEVPSRSNRPKIACKASPSLNRQISSPPPPPSGGGGSGGSNNNGWGWWEDNGDSGDRKGSPWLVWAMAAFASIPFLADALAELFGTGGVHVLTNVHTAPGQPKPIFAAVGVQGKLGPKTVTPEIQEKSAGGTIAIVALLLLAAGGTFFIFGRRKRRSQDKSDEDELLMEAAPAENVRTRALDPALLQQAASETVEAQPSENIFVNNLEEKDKMFASAQPEQTITPTPPPADSEQVPEAAAPEAKLETKQPSPSEIVVVHEEAPKVEVVQESREGDILTADFLSKDAFFGVNREVPEQLDPSKAKQGSLVSYMNEKDSMFKTETTSEQDIAPVAAPASFGEAKAPPSAPGVETEVKNVAPAEVVKHHTVERMQIADEPKVADFTGDMTSKDKFFAGIERAETPETPKQVMEAVSDALMEEVAAVVASEDATEPAAKEAKAPKEEAEAPKEEAVAAKEEVEAPKEEAVAAKEEVEATKEEAVAEAAQSSPVAASEDVTVPAAKDESPEEEVQEIAESPETDGGEVSSGNVEEETPDSSPADSTNGIAEAQTPRKKKSKKSKARSRSGKKRSF